MEKFIVSARKYRPNNFLSLIGQESIATTLKNSIKRDQLAHAYLFCGPRGVGKTSTARIFAKTINCLNLSADLEPCEECESCKSFAEGRSYCIHELDAASNNSVDDIRLLTEKVMIPPQIGKYSVYIIDEVHMLSSAAFNAFLKTLEEPPAHAIFILATTEKHKILPTILSRCQTYDFNRISIEDIVKNLSDIAKKEDVTIDTDSLHVIAQKADGAMRDALTLFDQTVAFCGTNVEYSKVIKNLNVLDTDYYFNLTECALAGNFAKSLLLFDEILSKGFNALYFITGLNNHFRNLLVTKDTSTLKLLEFSPSVIEKYKNQGAKCSFKFLYEALANTTKCEADYRLSSNQRLLVEFLLIKLCEINNNTITPNKQEKINPASPITNATNNKLQEEKATASADNTQEEKATASADNTHDEKATIFDNKPQEKKTSISSIKSDTTTENNNITTNKGGLSIKNIIKKAQATPQTERRQLVTVNEPITYENLLVAWEKMANSQTQYPRLATAIKQTKPELKEDNTTIIFKVGNSAQQSWIEKNSLPSLIAFLQKELKNSNLNMKVEIVEVAEQEKKLYMPHEKAEFLLKNNPELVELRKDLDLEIK